MGGWTQVGQTFLWVHAYLGPLPLLLVKFPGSQEKCQNWTSVTTWLPSLTLTWTWTIR